MSSDVSPLYFSLSIFHYYIPLYTHFSCLSFRFSLFSFFPIISVCLCYPLFYSPFTLISLVSLFVSLSSAFSYNLCFSVLLLLFFLSSLFFSYCLSFFPYFPFLIHFLPNSDFFNCLSFILVSLLAYTFHLFLYFVTCPFNLTNSRAIGLTHSGFSFHLFCHLYFHFFLFRCQLHLPSTPACAFPFP